MRKSNIVGLVGAATLMFGGAAGDASADDNKLGYSLMIQGNSDYMFRGISYSSQDPIINSYLELTYSIFYLGLYTSKIDYGAYGPWEQDIYVGFRPVTGPINWDMSANWYLYGNRNKSEFTSVFDIDYVEFKIGATTALTSNLTVGANVWLTPDQGYAATSNISVEGTMAYNLPKMGDFSPSLSALVGHSESGTNKYYPDGYWVNQKAYTYWNAGLKVSVDKYFMDFRYWDTTIDDPLADSRFVFSAGVNLLP